VVEAAAEAEAEEEVATAVVVGAGPSLIRCCRRNPRLPRQGLTRLAHDAAVSHALSMV